jgi:aryl-alcohol dehydrogenase (NADP+)
MYYKDADFDVVARVSELAARMGHKPAQVALAWLLNKPGVDAPIIGATKMYQLEDAFIATSIKLSHEENTYLEEPYVPHPILGH